MKAFLPIVLVMLAVWGRAAAEDPILLEAEKDIEGGMPQAAVHKLRSKGRIPEADRVRAGELLGRALFLSGRPDEAVKTLDGLVLTPEGEYWLGQSLAALGQWKKALPHYAAAASAPMFPLSAEALIGQARMFRAVGNKREAAALLETVAAKPNAPEKIRLELARMELEDGEPEKVLKVLEDIPASDGGPSAERAYLRAWALEETGRTAEAIALLTFAQGRNAELTVGVPVLLARCYTKRGELSKAEETLESFIQDQPRHPDLQEAFAELEKIYFKRREVSDTELRRWYEDADEPQRRALALYFLARNDARAGNSARNQERLEKFVGEFPDHPLAARARVDLAQSFLNSGDPARALAALEKIKAFDAHAEFVMGLALAAGKNYQSAERMFLSAAHSSGLDAAWYNAAICGLLAGVPEKHNAGLQQLIAQKPDSAMVRDLRFRTALLAAGRRDARTEAMLRGLADEKSPEMAAAGHLALAEWYYEQLDLPKARDEWQRISSEDPEITARKDALGVFLADTGEPGSEAEVLAKARAFLSAHPGAAFEPEVRMKLGEMLFRRGDYQGARDAFDELSRKFPDSPLAPKAQYLAAESLSRSMDPAAREEAIQRYDDLAVSGGDLALRARFAQAMLQNALKRPEDALGVMDRILELKPDAELRYAVLVGKGDTFFSLGKADPENFRRAIGTWKEIASDSKAPRGWKNQALYKMGSAHQNLGESDAALSCYHEVISQKQTGEPEYFWFYKAGFDAANLLESGKRWNEAIAVYEKLAAADGPRAGEAKDRISRIRLENFLWED